MPYRSIAFAMPSSTCGDHKHKGKSAEDVSKAQWYLAKWQEIEEKGAKQ